jgi:hypothetical protein
MGSQLCSDYRYVETDDPERAENYSTYEGALKGICDAHYFGGIDAGIQIYHARPTNTNHWVHEVDGDDNNDGKSSDTPLKAVEKALSLCYVPKDDSVDGDESED